jgi:protein gp37
VEPLIAPIGHLDLHGVDWVIVGGESGPRARPMNPAWAIDVRNQCVAARVAFFFKQWGGRSPKTGGRMLEGREWNQFPKTRAAPQQQPELRTSA